MRFPTYLHIHKNSAVHFFQEQSESGKISVIVILHHNTDKAFRLVIQHFNNIPGNEGILRKIAFIDTYASAFSAVFNIFPWFWLVLIMHCNRWTVKNFIPSFINRIHQIPVTCTRASGNSAKKKFTIRFAYNCSLAPHSQSSLFCEISGFKKYSTKSNVDILVLAVHIL